MLKRGRIDNLRWKGKIGENTSTAIAMGIITIGLCVITTTENEALQSLLRLPDLATSNTMFPNSIPWPVSLSSTVLRYFHFFLKKIIFLIFIISYFICIIFYFLYQLDFDCFDATIRICVVDGL